MIDEKGKPEDVKIVNCPKVFEEAVLEAAWKWTFYPSKVDGKAVKAGFNLKVTFRLK